jgi:hypothetical protein
MVRIELYARNLGLLRPSRCSFHQERLMISVAHEPAPFRILLLFLKRRIPNHQSIVVNVAKSGWQEEMLKRTAYCSQIGWVRQVFIAQKLQIKSPRWTKNNLYRFNNESFVFVIFGEQLIFKAITAIDEGMGAHPSMSFRPRTLPWLSAFRTDAWLTRRIHKRS